MSIIASNKQKQRDTCRCRRPCVYSPGAILFPPRHKLYMVYLSGTPAAGRLSRARDYGRLSRDFPAILVGKIRPGKSIDVDCLSRSRRVILPRKLIAIYLYIGARVVFQSCV